MFQENGRSTPKIRIQENTSVGPVDSPLKKFQTNSDSTRYPQSEVDHLKSLITMARAECESEVNDSTHLASVAFRLHDFPANDNI